LSRLQTESAGENAGDNTAQENLQRIMQLENWLQSLPDYDFTNIRPASSDASFRRYFRVDRVHDARSLIVMDAPPAHENIEPFLHVTHMLRHAGVHAPEILAQDIERGFVLMSDLGDRPYLGELNADTADALYADAISTLVCMQMIENGLPRYDADRLRSEMDLFEPWYLNRHLGVELDAGQRSELEHIFALLIESALSQPQVFVHRDYHSRNLMRVDDINPGVIDYQDAVIGPITYDLVSLFKDCYIEWPRERVERWLDVWLGKTSIDIDVDHSAFLRWFDLMGVQRHLKVLGIFARLNYRDGKPRYLDDLPLTLKYVIDTCHHYAELAPLLKLLQTTVLTRQGVPQ
jgi:aminoglycoside/choline kinase family phosphotransferase